MSTMRKPPHYTPETSAKRSAAISAALKRKWATDPAYKTNQIRAFRKAASSPEYRAERAAEVKALWQDPAIRADRTARIRAACSNPESHERRCAAQQLRAKDPDYRAKQSAAAPRGDNHWTRRLGLSTKHREKLRASRLGHTSLDETRQLQREAAKRQWQDPERRARLVSGIHKHWTPTINAEHAKRLSNNENWRKAQVKASVTGAVVRPTAPERKMHELLDKLCPGEWRYTGDGDVFIGGGNPDFLHINGLKAIEVFGDWWHGEKMTGRSSVQEESSRIAQFSKVGVACLVVWEKELDKDQQAVKEKVTRFNASTDTVCRCD